MQTELRASRVLLIEDVPDVRLLVRTALRAVGGFTVTEAATGADAVTRAATDRPDLVILDLGLPDLAGQHLLAAVRTAAPTARVVVYTGTEPELGDLRGDVEGVVLKDAGVVDLVELVRSIADAPERHATLDLPNNDLSVGVARRFVLRILQEWRLPHLLDDALLVTSELATNAITHAASACRLTIAQKPASIRIDVHDTGAGVPDPQVAASTDEHGRGLLIVSALSAAWGLDAAPSGGKRVWAELATTPTQ